MGRTMRVTTGTSVVAVLLTVGAAIATLGAGGCNGSKGGPNAQPSPSPTPTQWAVFVYGSGRNLSSLQTSNAIANLTSVNQANTTIVPPPFFVEASYSGINHGAPAFTSTKRLSSFGRSGLLEVADLGQQSMTDPNELASFIKAAHSNNSFATHYCLILEGPGALPLLGVGADIAATTTLDAAALDTALTTGAATSGLAKFDLVVLDVPQGSTAEMLAVMSKHASFVVANEAAGATAGFDYAGLASALANNAAVDPATLAGAISNGLLPNVVNKSKAQQNEVVDMAMNLASAAPVLSAIDTLGATLIADLSTTATALPNVIAAIGSCRAAAVEIEPRSGTELVDLASFATLIQAQTRLLSAPVIQAAKTLGTAIGNNVKTGVVGTDYTGAGGLAIYFPHSSKTFNSNYSTIAAAFATAAPDWTAFLSAYTTALSTNVSLPAVTNLVVPATITQNQQYTVSATITPASMIHDVTLLVTQQQGGKNVVLASIPLGAPDAQTGNIATTQFMLFTAASAGSDGPFIFPRRRNASGSSPKLFAIDCDQEYTTAGGNTTVGGYMKAEVAVASVNSLAATSWVPFELNGAVGRNDIPLGLNAGVTYTLFPRTVIVDNAGNISSVSQTTNALRSTSGRLIVDPNQLLNQTTPIAATVWLVAETFNGDLAVRTVNVQIQ